MDPTRINWSMRVAALLNEDSDIPTDVTFKFVKSSDVHGEVSAVSSDGDMEVPSQSSNVHGEASAVSSDVHGEASTDGGVEVSAHKMILAMVSPVLRSRLYMQNTQVIFMEDITEPIFRIFINAIYGVTTIQEALKGNKVEEIFAVLDLVKKYEVQELVQAVQEMINSFPLTDDNVLEVADAALKGFRTERKTAFFREAHSLFLSCAKFLKAKLTRAIDVLRLIRENSDRMEVIKWLAGLLVDMAEEEEEEKEFQALFAIHKRGCLRCIREESHPHASSDDLSEEEMPPLGAV